MQDVRPLNVQHCRCRECAADSDDDTSLACTQVDDEPTVTPLPKLQLFIIIFIQIAEPVTSTVIYPFVNQLVRGLGVTGGDEKKTGYYVGIVESIFYAAEALTVISWGRASDRIGRRPILLGGMLGLGLSMLSFGLSNKYWMLIASRCAQGAFNGNIGVTKSVMAEITDATNAPQAFSFLPVAWSIGSTLGPFIGGVFANPAVRWPLSSPFFHKYPYFLPCMVAALVPVVAFLFAFLGLKETLPSAIVRRTYTENLKSVPTADEVGSPISTTHLLVSSPSDIPSDYGSTVSPTNKPPPLLKTSSPPPFRAILTPRALIVMTNFAFLAFLDQSLIVLLPLIYSTPLHLGGLGLPPSTIGTLLGLWGVFNGFIQVFCFTWVRNKLGQRSCYISGIAGLGLAFALFPMLAWVVQWNGGEMGPWVWIVVGMQLGVYMFAYMSYACMFMYIAASASSRSSLGTTNGLAQLTASSMRALAPSAASSLFSLSLELKGNHTPGQGIVSILGGYLVYLVLGAISIGAVGWGVWLPKELETRQENEAIVD